MLLWAEFLHMHDSGAAAVYMLEHFFVVQLQSRSLQVKSASTPMALWPLQSLM